MSRNKAHIARVKAEPNDECYTPESDIESELTFWSQFGKLKNKNIICPCDVDIPNTLGESFTIIYHDPYIELRINSVKTLQDSLWFEPVAEQITFCDDEYIEDMLKPFKTANFVKVLHKHARDWGIKSITASGFNPDIGEGTPYQNVDFSKYDVCITNPPFHNYHQFVNCVVGVCDYLALAPALNRLNPGVGTALKLKNMYIGYNEDDRDIYGLGITFNNLGKKTCVLCDWLTSWPDAQIRRNQKLAGFRTDVHFEPQNYRILENLELKDGSHPIEVKCNNIPGDYDGWMFAPPGVISRYSLDEIEWWSWGSILDLHNRGVEVPVKHKLTEDLKIDNQIIFSGILFRFKKGVK